MWYLVGLIVGGFGIALIFSLRNTQYSLRWYEYVVGLIALVSLSGAAQHYFASVDGEESKSALMGTLLFAAVGFLLAVIDWQLVVRHKKIA